MDIRCKKCGAVLAPNQNVCHICGLIQTDDRGLINPKLRKKLMKQYQRENKLAKLAKYFMWLCVLVSAILIFTYPNFLLTKIICVSLLIIALVVSPFVMYFLGAPIAYVAYCALGAIYIVYLHRENIKRLINGNENKVR